MILANNYACMLHGFVRVKQFASDDRGFPMTPGVSLERKQPARTRNGVVIQKTR